MDQTKNITKKSMQTQEKILKQIKLAIEPLANDLKKYKIILFGSRARKDAKQRSDFDIGILGKEPLNIKTFNHIEEKLDNISTLYSIDLVELSKKPDSFKQEALKDAIILLNYDTETPN